MESPDMFNDLLPMRRGLVRLMRTKVYFRQALRNNLTVAQIFEETARRNPNKIAFRTEDKQWTFQEVRKSLIDSSVCDLRALGVDSDVIRLRRSEPFSKIPWRVRLRSHRFATSCSA